MLERVGVYGSYMQGKVSAEVAKAPEPLLFLRIAPAVRDSSIEDFFPSFIRRRTVETPTATLYVFDIPEWSAEELKGYLDGAIPAMIDYYMVIIGGSDLRNLE